MWSTKPQEFSRPSPVDNYPFLCDHGKVVFDLNEGDRFMMGVFLVPIDVWNCILELWVLFSVWEQALTSSLGTQRAGLSLSFKKQTMEG